MIAARHSRLSVIVALVGGGALFGSAAAGVTAASDPSGGLRVVESFNEIADPKARSIALFEEAGKVIQHPRCLNCHPRSDRPTQGDEKVPHIPKVVRGKAGEGVPGMHCGSCHHDQNYEASGVPGSAHWKLAPPEMAWEGLSLGDICRQIKDPQRNGSRTLDEIVHHMTHDELVGWGWHPGGRRTPVPGTQAQFGKLIEAWVADGAYCPA